MGINGNGPSLIQKPKTRGVATNSGTKNSLLSDPDPYRYWLVFNTTNSHPAETEPHTSANKIALTKKLRDRWTFMGPGNPQRGHRLFSYFFRVEVFFHCYRFKNWESLIFLLLIETSYPSASLALASDAIFWITSWVLRLLRGHRFFWPGKNFNLLVPHSHEYHPAFP